MNRFFHLLLSLPIVSFSLNSQVRLLSYDASAVYSDSSRTITASVALRWLANEDLGPVTIHIPEGVNVVELRNTFGERLEFEPIAVTGTRYSLLKFDAEDATVSGDTGSCIIRVTIPPSSDEGRLVLTSHEILLFANDSIQWLPHLSSAIPEEYSLHVELPLSITILQNDWITVDTLERSIVRMRRSSVPDSFFSLFTLFGFFDITEYRSEEAGDTVSLFIRPGVIESPTGRSFVRRLTEARRYFYAKTRITPSVLFRRYFFIATDSSARDPFLLAPGLSVYRSPEILSEFDTLRFRLMPYDRWIDEAANEFLSSIGDSASILREGFRRYLTIRFGEERSMPGHREQRYRLTADLLTFYPFPPLVDAASASAAARSYYSSKAAYFFLMLEFLVGETSFDTAVQQWLDPSSGIPPAWNGLRRLLEAEYGSSLVWFFDQWLNSAGFPDLVMQWKSEKTIRGSHIVTVTVEQRGELFTVPVPIVFSFGARTVTKRIVIDQPKQEWRFTFPGAPTGAELDPQWTTLRWLRELRIPAHARSAMQYLTLAADTANAEREALYTIQLDPTNATGSAPLTWYVLGNIAAARGDNDTALEYFFKAVSSDASEFTGVDRLRSLVRYGNVMDRMGKRNDAVAIYQRAVREASADPVRFRSILRRAQRYLHTPFMVEDLQRHD